MFYKIIEINGYYFKDGKYLITFYFTRKKTSKQVYGSRIT